ncbi:tol-pal system protein YbgF [Gallaecimonas kandeliae]|uniref:tol-pal system protein YbgF n=1 Tax=Gallaecimonas kandeliae TaxID=3029055 RepID=UPI002649205F|nr:tol-pal system protein YbgF [Gallaecimonas kandeliae]WKE64469.1 tol-pal system protein YbgF [Gallaecimonas kandeliae]
MNKPLTSFALLVGLSGAAHAAPAPVVEAGGDLESRVARLEAQLESRNRVQLETLQKISALQDDLRDLRGITEEHEHKLNQLLDRQREIYKELARMQSAPAAEQPAPTTAAPADTSPTYSSNLSENDAYDQAVGLVLKQKDYGKATEAFKAFVKDFPKSSYIDNAYYWLGQLYYSDRKLDDAIQSFTQVVNHYPNSSKRADAMLKLGIIAQDKGDKAGASAFFNKVIKEYPDSTSARMAKERLGKH